MTTGRTILIVEDDRDIADALVEIVEAEGFSARVVTNGLQALELLARESAPDLIVLDLLMPVMNGVAFYENLRRRDSLAKIPVLVLTAATTVTPPVGLPLLRKPFEVAEFLAAIRTLLARDPG